MPGEKHAWPKVAACWSPATPMMSTAAPSHSGAQVPNQVLEGNTCGNSCGGMSNSASKSASQRRVWMLNSIVRDALLVSVACTRPPVSFQSSQLSTVPKARSPASARARAPGVWSSSHCSLVAEKYASSTKPVLRCSVRAWPRDLSWSQAGAVRRSCHTMAGATGSPVRRSQSTVVSRWLVMPTAANWLACRSARCSAKRATASCVDQISKGSCSTQPAWG